jgi:hypothetical protein
MKDPEQIMESSLIDNDISMETTSNAGANNNIQMKSEERGNDAIIEIKSK